MNRRQVVGWVASFTLGIAWITVSQPSEKAERIIKNRDGQISEKNSHGNNPHPPKGW